MAFDASFRLSDIIALTGFVTAGFVFAITLRAELRALVFRVSRLEKATESVEKSLAALAVQDERLQAHARRLERLEGLFIGSKADRSRA